MTRIRKLLFLSMLSFGLAFEAAAATVVMTAVPTAWRLESYTGGQVMLWYTGSSCANGQLSAATTVQAEMNRLWALVLSAKIAQKNIFVAYDNAIAGCPLISFGLTEG